MTERRSASNPSLSPENVNTLSSQPSPTFDNKETRSRVPIKGRPPVDPTHSPYYKHLLLLGFVCPPVWWFAACYKRDMDDPCEPRSVLLDCFDLSFLLFS
ncbi:hypothetical protein M407DRAFT_173500 [Tulasnella calospora MUT 4182]|uniref:Uncharacterized protein n=1 Tax=Tulasnella calospora MUT 4182 TaxID=1051891 RepID=A0A0C3L5F4_9AGAM|nr:hypothetical protein M407DRAFT_173500 [Tulasnella calospora MUT 4182]